MSETLLDIRGLKTHFHTFGGLVKAVDGVSFDVRKGEVVGLVGESGGGKSVIGFSILRLIDPPGRIEAGEILFDGEDLTKKSEDELRAVRGGEIAMVFQDPMTSLNPVYTIGRQMDEMLQLHTDLDEPARRARCVRMLEDVGISRGGKRLDAYPHQFSGGMRQRVVIAIALLAGSRLIIADEPTTALDVTVQSQILKLMRRQICRARRGHDPRSPTTSQWCRKWPTGSWFSIAARSSSADARKTSLPTRPIPIRVAC